MRIGEIVNRSGGPSVITRFPDLSESCRALILETNGSEFIHSCPASNFGVPISNTRVLSKRVHGAGQLFRDALHPKDSRRFIHPLPLVHPSATSRQRRYLLGIAKNTDETFASHLTKSTKPIRQIVAVVRYVYVRYATREGSATSYSQPER